MNQRPIHKVSHLLNHLAPPAGSFSFLFRVLIYKKRKKDDLLWFVEYKRRYFEDF